MDIIERLSEELSIKKTQVEAAVGLIDEGNTIPFIARYRKEVTGSLDDEQLRALEDRLNYLRGLEKRKEEVRSAIKILKTRQLPDKTASTAAMITLRCRCTRCQSLSTFRSRA